MDDPDQGALADIAAGPEWDRPLVRALRTMRPLRRLGPVTAPRACAGLAAASAVALLAALTTGSFAWVTAFGVLWALACTAGFVTLCCYTR